MQHPILRRLQTASHYHQDSKFFFQRSKLYAESVAAHTKFKDHKITPEESGLRTRIRSLKKIYSYLIWYCGGCKTGEYYTSFNFPAGLVEKFLNIYPTKAELKQVLDAGKLKGVLTYLLKVTITTN
ncbi:MAG: hypothetical protein WAZ77_00410 [Candidatus Nitrosopolaris sp.]